MFEPTDDRPIFFIRWVFIAQTKQTFRCLCGGDNFIYEFPPVMGRSRINIVRVIIVGNSLIDGEHPAISSFKV